MFSYMNNGMKAGGCLSGLRDYIEMLTRKSVDESKEFIIWGYSKGGAFARYLLENNDTRCRIAYIVDNKMQIPAFVNPRIYRSSLFQYIDNSKYIVLSAIRDFSKVIDELGKYGYKETINLFNFRKDIGNSYIDYLQLHNDNIDFSNVTVQDRPDLYLKTDNIMSTPFDMTSLDEIMHDVSALSDDVSFLDFGCGKGQILFSAYMHDIKHLQGVELSEDIAKAAQKNMEVLGVPAVIHQGDACDFTDIDSVNVFYLNNPFIGKIFRNVIDNIEESIKRVYRNVYIVYLNPWCHSEVIKNGLFRLCKQKYTDVGDPLVNFYQVGK